MEKKTVLSGHFKDITVADLEGEILHLPKGINLILKDNNLTITLIITNIQPLTKAVGSYTITLKEP